MQLTIGIGTADPVSMATTINPIPVSNRPLALLTWGDLCTQASKNSWPRLVQTTVVSKNLVSLFWEIISRVFVSRGQLPNSEEQMLFLDCAVICAMLQSKKCFESFYIDIVDPLLEGKYFSFVQENEEPKKEPNRLMRSFAELMKPFGFNSEVIGVTFVGDAGANFGTAIGNRILFKDMTGSMHGEYTHMMQWLSICCLTKASNLVEGGHTFSKSIAEIYSFVIQCESETEMPSEIVQNVPKPPKKMTLWDFMVDAFFETQHQSLALDLYTDSYRCPANISKALFQGVFAQTFMGFYMEKRRVKMASLCGDKFYQPRHFHKYAKEHAEAKGRLQQGNTFGPDKPGWRV